MKASVFFALIIVTSQQLFAQVYVEKQTRHRFAQLNLGVDVQSSIGGFANYFNQNGELEAQELDPFISPRILIGGQHFWGHADFLLSIPLFGSKQEFKGQQYEYYPGVETALKYYPWRMTNGKLRPYAGASLLSQRYRQTNTLVDEGAGHLEPVLSIPILTGVTYSTGNHLLEAGVAWNTNSANMYYIDQVSNSEMSLPYARVHVSYRYVLETTLSAEPEWESGRTALVTDALAEKKVLNGIYIGAGLSSLFWNGNSSYVKENRPFMQGLVNSLSADVTAGYYFHKPDLHAGLVYRTFNAKPSAFGIEQTLNRHSFGVEVVKFLFDYHGFVPFAGPLASYEWLSFEELEGGVNSMSITDEGINYGVTFGWDIRPNRIQSFLLRTNLRWYPSLNIDTGSGTIDFSGIEFNFIQLIVFPGRL